MYCVNEQELGIVCVSPDCNCEDFDDDGLEVYQGTDWDEWDPEGDWDDEYDDEYWGYLGLLRLLNMPEKTIPYRVFRTVEQSKIVEIVCEEGDEDSAQAFADSIAWSSRNQDNAWINGEEIITDFGAERAE